MSTLIRIIIIRCSEKYISITEDVDAESCERIKSLMSANIADYVVSDDDDAKIVVSDDDARTRRNSAVQCLCPPARGGDRGRSFLNFRVRS